VHPDRAAPDGEPAMIQFWIIYIVLFARRWWLDAGPPVVLLAWVSPKLDTLPLAVLS
jgi:hypothetical protein